MSLSDALASPTDASGLQNERRDDIRGASRHESVHAALCTRLGARHVESPEFKLSSLASASSQKCVKPERMMLGVRPDPARSRAVRGLRIELRF